MSDVKILSVAAFNASDDQVSRLQSGVANALNPVLAILGSSQMILTQRPGLSSVGGAQVGAIIANPLGGAGNVGSFASLGSDGPNGSVEIHGDGSDGAAAYLDFALTPTADYDWRLLETSDGNLQIFQSTASLAGAKTFYINAPLGTSALSVGGTFSAPQASFRSEHYCGTVGAGPPLANGGFQDFSAYNQQTSYGALAPRMPFAGSVVAISAYIATGGTQTVIVDALKNGATFSCYEQITASPGGTYASATFAKGAFPFNAGDNLGARLTNIAGSTISSMNGYCYIWVETKP